MKGKTSIVVPPYHVQSTAAEVRAGFPYFAHHDSVSALWNQKWRTPCAHGIYPFIDAKVEDFDSIFAELVRTSGDQPDILYRPEERGCPSSPFRCRRLPATATFMKNYWLAWVLSYQLTKASRPYGKRKQLEVRMLVIDEIHSILAGTFRE